MEHTKFTTVCQPLTETEQTESPFFFTDGWVDGMDRNPLLWAVILTITE